MPRNLVSSVSGGLESKVKYLNWLMAGVVLVVVVGFVAAIITVVQVAISYSAERQETFQDLRDKVFEQNVKIDTLTRELSEHRSSTEAR